MATGRVTSDLIVDGYLTVSGGMSLPAGAVTNTNIVGSAGISASKLQHSPRKGYAQPNTTATTETRVIHVAFGAGTILEFSAGSIVAATAGTNTTTVDLKKNGTTCLSSVITLDSANSAYVVEAGTLSVTSLADGDVLTVVITATAGTGALPTGVFASVCVEEAYS